MRLYCSLSHFILTYKLNKSNLFSLVNNTYLHSGVEIIFFKWIINHLIYWVILFIIKVRLIEFIFIYRFKYIRIFLFFDIDNKRKFTFLIFSTIQVNFTNTFFRFHFIMLCEIILFLRIVLKNLKFFLFYKFFFYNFCFRFYCNRLSRIFILKRMSFKNFLTKWTFDFSKLTLK